MRLPLPRDRDECHAAVLLDMAAGRSPLLDGMTCPGVDEWTYLPASDAPPATMEASHG